MDIKKRIGKATLFLAASIAAGYIFVKGVETIRYKQLPKEQQKMFDSLKNKKIPNSIIISELTFLNSAQKALNGAKEAIDARETLEANYQIQKAEDYLSKTKYLDLRSIISDLEKIKSELLKEIKAQKLLDK